MSNPATLLRLAEKSPVVNNYLKAWEEGEIEWQCCIHCIHRDLVNQLRELSERFGLRLGIVIECCQYRVISNPLTSALNGLSDLQKLQQQEAIIEAIVLVLDLLNHFRKCVADKIANSQHAVILHNDGTLELSDRANLS